MQASPTLLSGRYRCVTTYPLPEGACWWVAIDADSGQHVAAAVVTPRDVPRFQSVRGEKHIHLAAITDVIPNPEPSSVPGGVLPSGAGVAVAELVPGQTLHGQLKRGRIHPFKAVAWMLRVIDAVQRLHGRRAAHGAISPYTIVVEPLGRAIAPVLGTLVGSPIAAYASPERLAGAGPSTDDDVWALHAVLYSALTGTVPFEGDAKTLLSRVKTAKPRLLADFGINEPNLQRIIDRGLAAEERARVSELEGLSAALDAWERGREPDPPRARPPRLQRGGRAAVVEALAFDVSALAAVDAVPAPEPAPAEAAPAAPARAPLAVSPQAPGEQALVAPLAAPLPAPAIQVPRPARRATWPWLLVGIVGLGGAGVAVALLLATGAGGPATSTTSSTPAKSSAAPSAAVSVAAPLTPPQQRSLCVLSFFEASSLDSGADLDFVCGDEPFPEIATRLFHSASPVGAAAPTPSSERGAAPPAGIVVTGANNPNDLGWFEIPAAVIIRTTCCPQAAPVTLPTTPGWCDQLQGQIRMLADASRKPIDLSTYGRKFEDGVQCLYSTGTQHGYAYTDAPAESHRRNFQRFLKHAAESDVKRSRMSWLR